MVVHQDVSVQLAACGVQGFMQQVQVAQSVAIIQKARQAVVPALHDVLRDAGNVNTRKSGHGTRLAARRWC
ncbi:hypothetical protein A7D17_09575 [Xanthomonas floridensis]|uniref:Uncharacterized protein n=1 Tax=Xanthomonas floridensis TaxID=1843580 RepID=A0A1A9M7W0_9XANT|nr:hypothetical protein A7D17_22035 [Xanthomonas floridensis]OAG69122.1 hypothetical protein A7D17_09575 [Xanthomonas floridensis]